MEHWWNDPDRETRSTLWRSCPSVRLYNTNVTYPDMASNPVLCSKRPAINRMNCGTTFNASRRSNNNNNNNTNNNNNFKLYYNRSILTDETILFNRPDITFMNKKTKNTVLTDIAVPNTYNLAKTKTDKRNEYQELANEICAMWKQNAFQVIPIPISTGVIPKSLSQSLKRLVLHPNTYIQMQKSVILGTCSIVRNFVNYK